MAVWRRPALPCNSVCDSYHHHGMRRDRGREFSLELSEIFRLPQIADTGAEMAGIAESFPGKTNLFFGGSAIEQDHGPAAVLHLLGPDFQVPILEHPAPFAAQR